MMIEISSSVFKRLDMDFDEAHRALNELGFEHVGTAAGGKIHYHENEAGMNFTIVDGPRAVSIFPSGPIRGRLFGNSGLMSASDDPIKSLESIAAGDNESTDNNTVSGRRGRTGRDVNA